MWRKFLYTVLILFLVSNIVLADRFVPEFNKMQMIRCDYVEKIYNQDKTLVSTSHQFRNYRLDDENNKLYLEKEPIDRVTYYGQDKIEFDHQSMTDEFIMMSKIVIDRNTFEYTLNSTIMYDNPVFGKRYSNAVGTCKIIK